MTAAVKGSGASAGEIRQGLVDLADLGTELAGQVANEHWMDDGLCKQVDPELFFVEKGGSTKDAKSICLGCDVRAQCLAYALERNEVFGIWGGLTYPQRRDLKKLAAAATAPSEDEPAATAAKDDDGLAASA